MSTPIPITPEEALKPADISDLIPEINKLLEEPWDSYTRGTGRTLATSGMGSRAQVEAVLVAYKTAGWCVSRIDDQRGGSYLKFLPPKETV